MSNISLICHIYNKNYTIIIILAKPTLKPIIRTIENDLEIIDDPMEEDHIPIRTALTNGKQGLQLKIVTHNNNVQRYVIKIIID